MIFSKQDMTPEALWGKYQKGVSYNERINLYRTVEVCENFYAGRQWEEVDAPDIDKPMINIISQPVNYMVATIVSDDVAISLKPCLPSEEDERYLKAVVTEVERVREQIDSQTVNREQARNAAIDGDACLMFDWDSELTDAYATGDVVCYDVENTNCLFGNPNERNPQKQPYIIIVMRQYLDDVIDEAVENGMDRDEAREKIKPSSDSNQGEIDGEDTLVTKILTYWRDTKTETIHYIISTERCIIKGDTDLKLKLYPIAWFSWQKSRRSYHGISAVAQSIPNQIALNKLLAAKVRIIMSLGFPKIVYDRTRFPKGWNSRLGQAVEVQGNVEGAYAQVIPGTGSSAEVSETIEVLKSGTREAMGANDAALGQMKSDNTSALIAMQEANTIPLDLVQRSYYNFQEQIIRIILDLLRVNAGTRYIELDDETKEQLAAQDAAMAAMQNPETATYDDMGMEYNTEDAEGMDMDAAVNAASQLPDKLFSPVTDSADTIGTEVDVGDASEGTMAVDFSKLGDMALRLRVDVGSGAYWSEAISEKTMDNLFAQGALNAIQRVERINPKYLPDKTKLLEEMRAAQEAQEAQAAAYSDEETVPEELNNSIQKGKQYIEGLRPTV
jgi:hypothetical protein